MKKTAIVLLAAALSVSSFNVYAAEVAEEKTYTITYNQNEGNTENMPEYQFVSGNMAVIVKNDSRVHVQVDLKLDGKGEYELISNCYNVENGKVAEVGDDSGVGMTMITTAEGAYEENEDGTVTIYTPEHLQHELATDTYSSQMKDVCGIQVLGNTDDGKYDSKELPEIVTMVPETIFTLGEDGKIENYTYLHPEEYETNDELKTEEAVKKGNELIAIMSNDEQTSFTLFDNGTYKFYFESYDITDEGTYTFDGDSLKLTITDINGNVIESEAEGENIVFHYAYSQSEQLMGDFTVNASELKEAMK